MSKTLTFVGFAFSLAVGGFIGYAVTDHMHDKSAKATAEAALVAQAKAVEGVRQTEAASRRAVERASLAFEELRSRMDAQKPIVETKIREIYRNVPAPAPDCAAPADARRLLVEAGANHSAG